MKALEIRGLTKRYPGFVMENLNLELEEGFVLGLLGPNGAGKTTLLKAIADLVRIDGGSVLLFGRDSRDDLRAAKQRMAFVHEEHYLYDDRSPRQLERILAPFYDNWDSHRYAELLERFSLDSSTVCKNYSKGMKTKLRLAIAFSHNAELILMDEPASGLDPLVRREILALIGEELARENRTVIFSSHITEDLDRICDFVAIMDAGSLLLHESKETLRESWTMVKGGADLVNSDGAELLTGIQISEYGCTALTNQKAELQKRYPGDLVFEQPSLGDLMVHMIGGQ
jgi:ABC-2 type transport system ATP-binding protein